jgi:Arc/MetJ-type ribon-helix-helix transcriptional regulator
MTEVRLPQELIKAIDAWATREGAASRSEAIRRLVIQSLTAAAQKSLSGHRHKGASKAREMANQALDLLSNRSLPDEELKRRKRRLTKGPKEFRELRDEFRSRRAQKEEDWAARAFFGRVESEIRGDSQRLVNERGC